MSKVIQYNKDHTAEVITESKTHVLLRLDTGEKYCVEKINLINELKLYDNEIRQQPAGIITRDS